MLGNLNLDEKDMRITKNIYWQQKSAITIDSVNKKGDRAQ